jgi:hypothetical protein
MDGQEPAEANRGSLLPKQRGAPTRHIKTRPAYLQTILDYTEPGKIVCLSGRLRRMTFVITAR